MSEDTGGTNEAAAAAAASGDTGVGDTGGVAKPAASAAAAPWHGIADADTAAYIANKGWTDIPGVVKSYQAAEKFVGKNPEQLLLMPRADDPAGMRELQTRLGLPESGDKYEFDIAKDMQADQSYMDWAKGTFHKAGLTNEQVKLLSAEHNNFARERFKREADDYELNVKADQDSLLQEWGGGHDRMVNNARAAAASLGFSEDAIDGIESKIGFAGTMKLFAGLGVKMGEHGFVGSGEGGAKGFGDIMTPAEAGQQWESTKMDANFQAALFDKQHPGHKGAVEKQSKLFAIMYPKA